MVRNRDRCVREAGRHPVAGGGVPDRYANQQVLQVQQVSYSPLEKIVTCKKVKRKKGNGVENLLNLLNLLVFITGLIKILDKKAFRIPAESAEAKPVTVLEYTIDETPDYFT